MPLSQHYLDWNRPLIPQVRERLLSHIDGNQAPIDLSQWILIVPTNQSGRHLLEALADNAITQSKGLLSPKIFTPVQFLENGMASFNRANEAHCTSAWIEVFKSCSISEINAIFPQITHLENSFILSSAQRFFKLKNEIGAEGMSIKKLAEKCQKMDIEAEKWQQMAQLESKYLRVLKEKKLIDPNYLKQLTAHNYPLDASVSKIIMIATPDPQTLALEALKRLNKKTNIEVWINGPDDGLFDDWGIPHAHAWQDRELALGDWNLEIKKIKHPLNLAPTLEKAINLQAIESVQIGLLDRSLVNDVNNYFKLGNQHFNNPEGCSLSQSAIGKFILSLLQLDDDLNVDHLRQLLLNPYFFKFEAPDLSLESLLLQIDQTMHNHLCYEISAFKIIAQKSKKNKELLTVIEGLENLTQSLNANNYVQILRDYLSKVIDNTGIIELDAEFIDLFDVINNVFEEHIENNCTFENLDLQTQKQLFSESIRKNSIYKERKVDAHDLLGWLELLWHDAPHSLLCGFNEGIVPRPHKVDALLPEGLRELLNLHTSKASYAKDLYLFECIGRKRKKNSSGKVTILICENDLDNNPLLPSRLLFQVQNKDLLAQTKRILIDQNPSEPFKNLSVPWKFSPKTQVPLPSYFSVSALKDYLQCPFRFYLRHILKIKPKELNQREMSPATFGTIFHNTVSVLEGQKLEVCSDKKTIQNKLLKRAENLIFDQFGTELSFALQMQKEALFDRLDAFINAQFEELNQIKSIEILSTETEFRFNLGNFEIHGTIDRIDWINGFKRLVDYKTYESPIEPPKAHLQGTGTKGEPQHLPSEAYFQEAKKTLFWKDLQLPLYCYSQIESTDDPIPTLAYFQIPKSQEKTGLQTWSTFTDSHLASAKSCAESILNCIEMGKFWPPNDSIDPRFDPYADYFPDSIAKAVNAEAFTNDSFASQ